MVEYTLNLDSVFGSLSDPTRRDILKRVAKKELSVSEIARPYKLSFAAISKHLGVLEKARLIIKHRRGKEQIIQLSPAAIKNAADYLENYRAIWENRFDSLDKLLKSEKAKLIKLNNKKIL
jgi:DNA-binding transcriptional ArsR family regulator